MSTTSPQPTISNSILRMVVAKICQDVGFNSGHVSALNVLSDLLAHYIKKLSSTTVAYANHCGRSEPCIDDLGYAFDLLQIDLGQLQDYVLNVESSPLPLPFTLPAYPLKTKQNRVLDNCATSPDSHRAEYYEDWLPSLQYKHASVITAEKPPEPPQKNGAISSDEILQNGHKSPVTPQISIEKAGASAVNDNIIDEEKPLTLANESKENDNAAVVEPKPLEESDSLKKKLIFRVSTKSIEESVAAEAQAKLEQERLQNQLTQNITATSHLMSSRAFLRFLQSPLYLDPESVEARCTLRASDNQRLTNNHVSRENSPEPDLANANTINGLISSDGLFPGFDDGIIGKKKKKRKPQPDFEEQFDSIFGDPMRSTIRTKEKRPKKPRKPKDTGGTLKTLIKVKGFGLDSEDGASRSMGDAAIGGDEKAGGAKKRNYKKRVKKEKPADYVERRGRPPKGVIATLNLSKPDLEDGELPPSPYSLSPSSRSISPMKAAKGNKTKGDLFGDGDAANVLMSLCSLTQTSNSNHDEDSRKRGFDDMESSDEMDDAFGETGEPSTSKKQTATNFKRHKGAFAKKVIKSAEVVESSGDSSSDDNDANIDANPVSLLPPPPDITLASMIDLLNPSATGRKRNHSGSSISSLSSSNSAASSLSKRASSLDTGLDLSLKGEKSHKSKDEKKEKHKKKKKRDKHGEEKSHKKHKKSKEGKEKHKEKARPKLSIKLGPKIPDDSINRMDDPILAATSSLPKLFIDKEVLDESGKKKRGPKKKATELVQTALDLPIFIKEPSKPSAKEAKTKTPIINMTSKLFDDPANFDKISKPASKLKKEAVKLDFKAPDEKPVKIKKEKESGISFVLKTDDKSLKKTLPKEEQKREKGTGKKESDSKSCIVIRETIDVQSVEEDKVWICPQCRGPDDGTPMIGCDGCDEWYHYRCMGILHEPPEGEMWFCPVCINKQKQQQKKFEKMQKRKKEKKASTPKVPSSLTITPILGPSPPNLPPGLPGLSMFPVASTSKQTLPEQPALTITPTQGHNYKPTGRPRGRPRKDSTSSTSLKSSSGLTITPIPTPYENPFPPHAATEANFGLTMSFPHDATLFDQQYQPPAAPKRSSKEICPQCRNPDANLPMIECCHCRYWYHHPCVGIQNESISDSSWICPKCHKKSQKTQKLPKQVVSQPAWHDQASDDGSEDSGSISLTDAKFLAATGGIAGPSGSNRRFGPKLHSSSMSRPPPPVDEEEEVIPIFKPSAQWVCATCQQPSTEDDGAKWIACDECDQWYHFACEGVTKEPADSESWFCTRCIQRQKAIATKLAKMKRM